MLLNINKNLLILICGFIWGLSGFTVEIFPSGNENIQLLFRLVLIFISSFFILTSLEIKISKEFILGLNLIYFYLFTFIFSNFIHNIAIIDILREILLFIIIFILYVVISNEKILIFIKGLYISISLLIIYYFLSIDYGIVFKANYRLFTGLNPNAIGLISVMGFIISYYYYEINKKNYLNFMNWNKLNILIASLSFFVVLATKSRTSLIIFIIGFFVLSFYFKKKKLLSLVLILCTLIFISQYEIIESIFRLKQAENYGGNNSIYNLTGRTELWSRAIQVIENNFLLGVGSLDAYTMVDGHKGTYHNAYIQNFVTVGFLGTIPIVLLIIFSIKNLFLDTNNILIKILFVVGFISTFAESLFFNFGSPGSLIFLISLLILSKTRIKNT